MKSVQQIIQSIKKYLLTKKKQKREKGNEFSQKHQSALFDFYLNSFFKNILPFGFLSVSTVFLIGILPFFAENSRQRRAIRNVINHATYGESSVALSYYGFAALSLQDSIRLAKKGSQILHSNSGFLKKVPLETLGQLAQLQFLMSLARGQSEYQRPASPLQEKVETDISIQQETSISDPQQKIVKENIIEEDVVEEARIEEQTLQRIDSSESSEYVPLLKQADSTTVFFFFDVKDKKIKVSKSEKFGFETRNRLQRTGEINAFLPENQILRNREIVVEAVQEKEVSNEQSESSLGSTSNEAALSVKNQIIGLANSLAEKHNQSLLDRFIKSPNRDVTLNLYQKELANKLTELATTKNND